jgi:cytochrome c oxidase subunit 2
MGNVATNAPRYAGMSDWYLARQLKNFKDGVRGTHLQDYYGMQMGFMGRILKDEAAINDVVAYINTLDPNADLAARDGE